MGPFAPLAPRTPCLRGHRWQQWTKVYIVRVLLASWVSKHSDGIRDTEDIIDTSVWCRHVPRTALIFTHHSLHPDVGHFRLYLKLRLKLRVYFISLMFHVKCFLGFKGICCFTRKQTGYVNHHLPSQAMEPCLVLSNSTYVWTPLADAALLSTGTLSGTTGDGT